MRLVIERSQQEVKGAFGKSKGISFTLSHRIELTDEERELVRKYKLEDYPLTFTSYQGTSIPSDTISNSVVGRSQTVTDVTTLLGNERIIKDACDQLPVLFEVCRSFGGREVIDYPRES